MNVMIVDDSMVVRRILEGVIASLGIQIIATASNGRQALDLFEKHPTDLVTLDITMPEMDGLEVLKEIKLRNPGTKVIIISALKDRDTGVQALKLGASAFLIKPFSADQLIKEIDAVRQGVL